jgi:hypothetical protein
MLKKVLLSVLVLVFLGNIGFAQKVTKEQKSRFARIEYKMKLVGDAIVGERADGIVSPKVSTKPVETIVPNHVVKQINNNWTVTYTLTGGETIYDYQSNASANQIWQDPATLTNMHVIIMSSPAGDPTFTERLSKYYYSADKGVTWSYVGSAGNVRTGYPCITGTSEGNALVGCHGSDPAGGTTRILFYYDAVPGLGSFTLLDAGLINTPSTSNVGLSWPRIAPTQSVSLTNKFIYVGSQNGGTDPDAWRRASLSLTASSFDTPVALGGDQAETYSIAKSPNGKIGIAYVGNDADINTGSVYFVESTDNGATFSTALKIFQPNFNTDSLAGLRGICIAYQNEVAKVTFQTTKQTTAGSFFPGLPGNIRFWSPSLPGSDPNKSIIVADTNNVGYHPYIGVNDVMSTFNRPVIGASVDGTAIFIAFETPSDWAAPNGSDTTTFMDAYITASTDNGATWFQPQKFNFASPIRDWTAVSISKINDADAQNVYANITCLVDSVPASAINGTGISLAKQYFVRIQIPRTGITQIGTEIPTDFSLSQNYPNPFNPSTTIRFALPQTSNVTLKVYNMNGQEISTLISNTTVQAGTSEYRFDASNLASGIYFYKLTAGKFTDTKKMILIK